MSEQAGRSSLRVWHDEVRALAHVSIHNPPLGVLNQTVSNQIGLGTNRQMQFALRLTF